MINKDSLSKISLNREKHIFHSLMAAAYNGWTDVLIHRATEEELEYFRSLGYGTDSQVIMGSVRVNWRKNVTSS